MRTVIETYNVYNYNELSDEAKEKAKQWYLDDTFRTDDFTSMIEEDWFYQLENYSGYANINM